MKKLFSVLLVIAMLASVVVITAVPAAAVDGEWSVFSSRGNYIPNLEEDHDPDSIPGYEYVDEGLHLIPADWRDGTPYAVIQTSNTVDLKDGVYMEVRVDNFSYEGGDKWYGFSLTKNPLDYFVSEDDYTDYGGCLLARVNPDKSYMILDWCTSVTESSWDVERDDVIAPEANRFDDQGRALLTYEVRWNKADELYDIYFNGEKAPAKYSRVMTEYIEEECDGQVHVGFSIQNSQKGGTVECTILKYGTSAADAEVPVGNDSRAPENHYTEMAPIASPDTVEPGMPAIFMNGDKISSDTRTFGTGTGKYEATDDYYINVMASSSNISLSMSVKKDVSYDVKDFPIMMAVTRNFCTCPYVDLDEDGTVSDYEKVCLGVEGVKYYAMVGDNIQADENHANYCDASCLASNDYDDYGNHYGFVLADWSAYEGRIHAVRLDFTNILATEPGRNQFDVLAVAFFRTPEDAIAYYGDMMDYIIGERETTDSTDEETTEPTVDVTTDPTVDETTEPASEVTTDPKEETTEKTEKTTEKDEQTTEKTEQTTNAPVDGGDEGGCASVAGVGVVCVVALAVAGLVSFRKKED